MEHGWQWRLFAITVAALALYGLLMVVNAGAFLFGIGPERAVHIERIRTEVIATTDPEGLPTFIDVRVGVGFYLDDRGRRHAVELVGFDGESGDVVRTRRPLLPDWLVLAPHRRVQAVAELFLGLLALAPAPVMYRLRDE